MVRGGRMKVKYRKYTKEYMEYLSNNHNRYTICKYITKLKLKDFLYHGYWKRELEKKKLNLKFGVKNENDPFDKNSTVRRG